MAADSIIQIFIICKAFTSTVILHFRKQEKSDSARSGLCGRCSKMSQWNCSRSKACVCRAVCGRALSCNRTISRESLPLRQDNLRTHRPAENELHFAPRSRRDSQSAQPCPQLSLNLLRDKIQRTPSWGNFQHHTEHQKLIIGCNKTGARTVCANVLYFLDEPRIVTYGPLRSLTNRGRR